MLDLRTILLVLIAVSCALSNKNEEQRSDIATHGKQVMENGCLKGMQPKQVDSLSWRACVPDGVHWQVEEETAADGQLIISFFQPRGSSPSSYDGWSPERDFKKWNHVAGNNDPESEVSLGLVVGLGEFVEGFSWEKYRNGLVGGAQMTYDLGLASPDTLDELQLGMREAVLFGGFAHRGEAKLLLTRNGVDWYYDLWVRKLEHSGHIRAGIAAMNEKEGKHVIISADWIREKLPNNLEEVRSDSMFLMINEVVESFEWLD